MRIRHHRDWLTACVLTFATVMSFAMLTEHLEDEGYGFAAIVCSFFTLPYFIYGTAATVIGMKKTFGRNPFGKDAKPVRLCDEDRERIDCLNDHNWVEESVRLMRERNPRR